jgi:hypothetical protein
MNRIYNTLLCLTWLFCYARLVLFRILIVKMVEQWL